MNSIVQTLKQYESTIDYLRYIYTTFIDESKYTRIIDSKIKDVYDNKLLSMYIDIEDEKYERQMYSYNVNSVFAYSASIDNIIVMNITVHHFIKKIAFSYYINFTTNKTFESMFDLYPVAFYNGDYMYSSKKYHEMFDSIYKNDMLKLFCEDYDTYFKAVFDDVGDSFYTAANTLIPDINLDNDYHVSVIF